MMPAPAGLTRSRSTVSWDPALGAALGDPWAGPHTPTTALCQEDIGHLLRPDRTGAGASSA
jgi:hypothetical protein